MNNKLMIIDVDALLGNKNVLHSPCCLRSECDKSPSFRGKEGRCKLGRWCASAYYHSENILSYRSEVNITEDNCYMAALPALDKLADAGWLFSLWTTRPRKQTFNIIRVLRKTGIWDKVQAFSWTHELLNNSNLPINGDFSPATEKLKLFERVYGRVCNYKQKVVAIESDSLEASVIQSYGGSGLIVHISPRIWLDILVIELEMLEKLLIPGKSKDYADVVIDRAS